MMDSIEGFVNVILGLLFTPQIFVPLVYPGLLTAAVMAIVIIWLERKVAAKVQLRYGPLYVTKRMGGVTQLVADLIKFFFAEVIVPRDVDKLPFKLGPALLLTFSLLPVVALPVSGQFEAFRSDATLFLAVALLSVGPIYVIIVGWASNNKFALIGGLREGYLLVCYELPVFISALAMAVLYGSLDLVELVRMQGPGLWGALLNPFAAVSFLVATFMSTSRFPFEIAEAESEIVMGPYTEYSGICYGLCMAYSYIKLYVKSILFALVFLGGWLPTVWPFTLDPTLPGLIVAFKAAAVMLVGVFLRAVYPRYRIDQALQIGWRPLFALSTASLVWSLFMVGVKVGGWV